VPTGYMKGTKQPRKCPVSYHVNITLRVTLLLTRADELACSRGLQSGAGFSSVEISDLREQYKLSSLISEGANE
jgi:hypothetical protein